MTQIALFAALIIRVVDILSKVSNLTLYLLSVLEMHEVTSYCHAEFGIASLRYDSNE